MPDHARWNGRVLRGKWRIDARIARGGVGTVFAATHKIHGHRVAIKVLHPEFSRDDDAKSRFLQEGYAANGVNHPGVVRILDDDVTEDGLAFLVMELLEGEVLERRRIRKGGRLPLHEIFEVGGQLLDIVAAAHDAGVIHRDIKPENLFLTTEGRLKVLDFGFAQMKSGLRKERTVTGYLLGTPGFMSPEQALGERSKIDAQADIWSVGATLFVLTAGEPVHAGETVPELLMAAAHQPARRLATVAPNVPPGLAHVIDNALAFDKSVRWPNARLMQAALRAVPDRPAPGGAPVFGRPSLPPGDGYEALDSADLEPVNPSWKTAIDFDARPDEGASHLPEDADPTIATAAAPVIAPAPTAAAPVAVASTPQVAAPRGPYRALVLVTVALVSMVVVIGAGMAILALSN